MHWQCDSRVNTSASFCGKLMNRTNTQTYAYICTCIRVYRWVGAHGHSVQLVGRHVACCGSSSCCTFATIIRMHAATVGVAYLLLVSYFYCCFSFSVWRLVAVASIKQRSTNEPMLNDKHNQQAACCMLTPWVTN